jgi:anaerobic ribonucleoside-triphosphate reductase activating protein
MTDPLLLNLAMYLPRSRANGPGTRMVVWVQGCPFRCPGCQNPDYLAYQPNKIVTVDRVWQRFQQTSGLDGISFSGGEPFAQAVGLAELAKRVRDVGKTVVCWTGYRLEQLNGGGSPAAVKLLTQTDLLIDGLFQSEQSGHFVMRGSANQRLHFLSGRIRAEDLQNIPRQEWLLTANALTYTGFPN